MAKDGDLVSRSAKDGWGVQIVDCKLANTKDAYDKATVALTCEALSGEAHIGVVGSNYLDWSTPLHESRHCTVVRIRDGVIIQKGSPSTSSVGPIKSGAQTFASHGLWPPALTARAVPVAAGQGTSCNSRSTWPSAK